MTSQDFHNRFDYKDGVLYYKKTAGSMKKGSKVGTKDKEGYIITLINRKRWRVHRIIFCMHYNYLPQYIDHIDGNPENNKVENLRPATMSENNLNRGKHKRNTSGYKGVTWVASANKYSARIAVNAKRLFLGYFNSPKEAHLAYCRAAAELSPTFVKVV